MHHKIKKGAFPWLWKLPFQALFRCLMLPSFSYFEFIQWFIWLHIFWKVIVQFVRVYKDAICWLCENYKYWYWFMQFKMDYLDLNFFLVLSTLPLSCTLVALLLCCPRRWMMPGNWCNILTVDWEDRCQKRTTGGTAVSTTPTGRTTRSTIFGWDRLMGDGTVYLHMIKMPKAFLILTILYICIYLC